MALNKEAKINFLGMEANIYDTFIKAYIDKPAQDFFETRAYSFWQHKKVIGAYSGSEPSESLKSEFKSFMKQQVDVKYTCNQFIVASVLSLNEIIGPDKLDMVMKELNYVVANALAQTEYYGKVEEKAQIVKDAVDIYTKNFKSMHPDININFLGVDSTTCQEFIEKIESTGTKNFDNITEDERRAEKIGDDFKTYSTPMDVNFICKQILPLVPGILANIDVNDNDTLTKISNIIEDVIADPMKFGTIATFGAISVGQSQINASMPSFRRGAIGGGQGHDISAYQLHNAQENTLAILNYVKNRTGGGHNIILSKLQGLLPAIIPILKNPNSLPIVQNLVENILSSRPDSMRFVYKNIIDLLNDPANSTALRENPESLNILTKVIMDIIESSLVTNNYSETAKNSSLLGFLMNDKHNDKKSLLQIVEPLLNRVLTAVVQDDPEAGFLRSSLLSVLQTLNISEIDGTSSLVSNHNLNQSQIDSLALKINSMD
ncbi:MAG: hypothetical protein VX335_00115, partial [Pseudomonadota bacterium]|nr:hypothetical protein [Pseudomonadota bacterium]